MKFILFVSAILMANSVLASNTDCPVEIDRIWAGDEGYIWFHFTNGGSFRIPDSDPDQKSILSMGMASLMANTSIIARYDEPNIEFNSTKRDDLLGIYLFGRKL